MEISQRIRDSEVGKQVKGARSSHRILDEILAPESAQLAPLDSKAQSGMFPLGAEIHVDI